MLQTTSNFALSTFLPVPALTFRTQVHLRLQRPTQNEYAQCLDVDSPGRLSESRRAHQYSTQVNAQTKATGLYALPGDCTSEMLDRRERKGYRKIVDERALIFPGMDAELDASAMDIGICSAAP